MKMRGAAVNLLCSLPRRGRLSQEAPTLSNLSNAYTSTSATSSSFGQDLRSEPPPVVPDSKKLRESEGVRTTPTPFASPVFLLEGDEFLLSSSGVARTYYELAVNDKGEKAEQRKTMSLEEHYFLKAAKKSFVLRSGIQDSGEDGPMPKGKRSFGIKHLGSTLIDVAPFEIQEIDHGVLGSAGTGATTWEASIAMSLFWSSHADLLLGDVIELGSGVGLGGILSGLIGTRSIDSRMTSMTLTDHNEEVLEQCKENLLSYTKAAPLDAPISIDRLDWHDFLKDSDSCSIHHGRYDTVIASDCAYRYQDLVALARTMKSVLKPNSSSRIHFFGPYNRGAIHDLLRLLQLEGIELATEYIDMKRYRLQPQNRQSMHSFARNLPDVEMCGFASQTAIRFLHATAFHKISIASTCSPSQIPLAEID